MLAFGSLLSRSHHCAPRLIVFCFPVLGAYCMTYMGGTSLSLMHDPPTQSLRAELLRSDHAPSQANTGTYLAYKGRSSDARIRFSLLHIAITARPSLVVFCFSSSRRVLHRSHSQAITPYISRTRAGTRMLVRSSLSFHSPSLRAPGSLPLFPPSLACSSATVYHSFRRTHKHTWCAKSGCYMLVR